MLGYLLGLDENHTAREVGRIFGRRRLDDAQVVELRTGDEVEGEGTRVGLGGRHGCAIEPDLIVALTEATHHHELIVDERNALYATNGLTGILVRRPADLLGRDAAADYECLAFGPNQRQFVVGGTLTGDLHLAEEFGLLVHVYK